MGPHLGEHGAQGGQRAPLLAGRRDGHRLDTGSPRTVSTHKRAARTKATGSRRHFLRIALSRVVFLGHSVASGSPFGGGQVHD